MFVFKVPNSIVLFLVLLTIFIILFIIRGIIRDRAGKRRKNIKEKEIESIRNIIILLVCEAGIALLILYISLRYGEEPRFLALIVLFIMAVFNIFTALGLWKFRDKKWIRWVATVLSIFILFILSIVVQAIFPLIILALYHIGVAFVIICVITGIIIWIISSIKEIKKNKAIK